MLNRIRNWFRTYSDLSQIAHDAQFVNAVLNRELRSAKSRVAELELELQNFTPIVPEDIYEASKQLCREILKVKDFSTGSVLEALSPQERSEYVSAASVTYTSQAFKDVIKEIQYEQMRFAILNSDIGEAGKAQELIARGTINGADLIESRMAELHAEHLKNTKPDPRPEGMEKHEVVGTIY